MKVAASHTHLMAFHSTLGSGLKDFKSVSAFNALLSSRHRLAYRLLEYIHISSIESIETVSDYCNRHAVQ